MESATSPLGIGAMVGIAAGLWLLARGLTGYRTAITLGDTATSAIASMAAGEVRIAGIVEPAEVTLVSPLQSEPCVFYRATILGSEDTGIFDADFREERAVGFQVRDDSGVVRVFPRGARWDVPDQLDDHSGSFGELPPGVRFRTGSAVGLSEPDHATAVARLLTIQPVEPLDPRFSGGGGGRRFREARLSTGDPVTIIGRAMPFGDLADPAEADVALGSDVAPDDPEVAADLAAARATGALADDPEDAWGNAAIPGFGIGRPTRAPELDPAADPLPIAPAAEADKAALRFAIAPETLVVAGGTGAPLLVAAGIPGAAVARQQDRFLVGLLGAALAIASAMVFAIVLSGGLAT